MIKIIFIILVTLLYGCFTDEHPSYEPIQNSIQSGGPTIKYDPNSSLTNIPEIQSYLNKEDSKIFTKSLSWYGTESTYGLDKINNKNAKELVTIVNCLKTSVVNKQDKCFD